MSGDTAEATTVSGLATVIFTSGLLSAFLVNDIVCLVMTPFVLHVAQRLGLPPIPYLLAVATASNIGSTATITGNPQNMLIGSVSGIGEHHRRRTRRSLRRACRLSRLPSHRSAGDGRDPGVGIRVVVDVVIGRTATLSSAGPA
jgi:hypothetical protein